MKSEQGLRSKNKSAVLLVKIFLVLFSVASQAKNLNDVHSCAIDEIEDSNFLQPLSGQDFSCLTNYVDIKDNISVYQIISVSDDAGNLSSNEWQLSVKELRSKSFLKNRKLLLTGYSFSRVQAAEDCYILKAAGFDTVKQLINSDVFKETKKYKYQKSHTLIKKVSAKEILREYFHGNILLISTDFSISKKLDDLGISNYFEEKTQERIIETSIKKGRNGIVPIVMVADKHYEKEIVNWNINEAYYIDGGINALLHEINNQEITNKFRSTQPRRQVCGKS